jgi:hypothetical protein
MRAAIALGVVVVAGCYGPAVRDCTITCATGDRCAPGQVCGSDGWCASPSVAGHCRTTSPDAHVAPPPDARAPIDAASLCPLGCTGGTCDGDVCVIDCSADDSCQTDVHCPVNLPCRVICGNHACLGHVDCTKATSCDVTCSGYGSCQNEVDCGMGACDVACSGSMSCKAKNKCHPSCSCDVACTGAGSCMSGSECPQAGTTCVLGKGCTSQLASCDSCP